MTLRRRTGQVAATLAREATGWLGDRAGRRDEASAAPHLRRALADLGGAFVKLGQILSCRPDLLPPEYQRELARLQDATPPIPPHELERCLRQRLGNRPSMVFTSFDWDPLATGSIGQVHAARLADGRDVVVKVRRPGIVDRVEDDLRLLRLAAAVLVRHPGIAQRYDPPALAEEFATTIRAELDYVREAFNALRFVSMFAPDPGVHVPRVVWAHTGAGLVTLERIRGTKLADAEDLIRNGHDPAEVARRFALLYLRMVFVHGTYHADPHPGNFFVEPAGGLGVVDFGMVGVIAPRLRSGLATVLLGLAATDAARLAEALLSIGVAGPEVDTHALRADLERLVERYTGMSLVELELGPLLDDLMAVVRHHALRLPSELALLLKTVVMCEGVALDLDPDLDFMSLLLPFAARLAPPLPTGRGPWTPTTA